MNKFLEIIFNSIICSILALSDLKIYVKVRKQKKNNDVIKRCLTDVKNRNYYASSVIISNDKK